MTEPAIHLDRIAGFRLVTADLPRLSRFYQEVLGFIAEGEPEAIQATELALLGVQGGGARQTLRLGEQRVALERFDNAGRDYPAEGDAASPWFQHFALVVTDMAQAFSRLSGISPISIGGPQHLPESSGGAHAFKFRDPDGHPLELLQFAPAAEPAAWQGRLPRDGGIALGIDHSAISVADPEASIRFYSQLGLAVGERTRNRGAEQERLDRIPDVDVAVVPMMPEGEPPHLELLGYRSSRGAAGSRLHPTDVAATRIVWEAGTDALLADPDGHLQQLARGRR